MFNDLLFVTLSNIKSFIFAYRIKRQLLKDNTQYLTSLVNGDSKLLDLLYKRVFPKVISFIRKNKGQLQDAEDIFQKALLQIALRYKREAFAINSSFEAYLFTACKNLWRRELNKSKLRVTNEKVIERAHIETEIALGIIEQKRWELFTEKIEQLSVNCQQILSLFFKKTPYNQIAKQMNYNSELVVRQRVFKCKAKLTSLIKNDSRFKALKEF